MLRPQLLPSSRRLCACISSSAGALQRPLKNVAPMLPTLARRAYSDLAPPSTDTDSPPTTGHGTAAPRYKPTSSQTRHQFRRFPIEDEGGDLVPAHKRLQLRDACQCHQCVDPDSGQKSFTTTQLSVNQRIQSAKYSDDGSLTIVWLMDSLNRNETHVSVYSPEMLKKLNSTEKPRRIDRILWDSTILRAEINNCRISYDDWMAGGEKFWNAFAFLHKTGLIFLHDVPELETSVEEIGQQIGRLQDTFYGRTWDVVSKPKAENVAYTSQFLGLHQDLLYNKPTPRIQILHCLANDSEGGNSLFSDGVRAATKLKAQKPKDYRTLADTPVRFHYDKNEHFYQDEHATIKEYANGYIPSVWWSPPFQDSFHPEVDLRPWIKAARWFQRAIEDRPAMYECKMRPGECVVFDNLRVLHGRRKFTAGGGKRWLKGAYVSDQVFRGRTRRLMDQFSTHWHVSGTDEAAESELQTLIAHLRTLDENQRPAFKKIPSTEHVAADEE